MKKIFFFDIDGTLLDTSKGVYFFDDILYKNLKHLHAQGHIIAACTARPQKFVAYYLPDIFDCLILMNGSFVSVSGKILINQPFSIYEIEKYSKYFDTIDVGYIFIGNTLCWANNIPLYYQKTLDDIYMVGDGYTCFSSNITDSVYTIDLFFENQSDYSRIATMIDNEYILNYKYGDYTCDISFQNANKSIAIPQVLKYYGLSTRDAYAFGDGLNDIDVFKLIPNTCAVCNANTQLKKIASFVSKKNVAKGVLEGLQHWGYGL